MAERSKDKAKKASEPVKAIQDADPIPATLDPPSGEANVILDSVEIQEARGDAVVIDPAGLDISSMQAPPSAVISCSLFLKSAGVKPEHRPGFQQWAAARKLVTASIPEWRTHFEAYKKTPVR